MKRLIFLIVMLLSFLTLAQNQNTILDPGNATVRNLTGGGTYTGTWYDMFAPGKSITGILITVRASDTSASTGCKLYQFADSTTAKTTATDSFTVNGGVTYNKWFPIKNRYFAIKYTNGADTIYNMFLQTAYYTGTNVTLDTALWHNIVKIKSDSLNTLLQLYRANTIAAKLPDADSTFVFPRTDPYTGFDTTQLVYVPGTVTASATWMIWKRIYPLGRFDFIFVTVQDSLTDSVYAQMIYRGGDSTTALTKKWIGKFGLMDMEQQTAILDTCNLTFNLTTNNNIYGNKVKRIIQGEANTSVQLEVKHFRPWVLRFGVLIQNAAARNIKLTVKYANRQ